LKNTLRKRIIRVVSASAIIAITLMFGISVSSSEEEVVKADTPNASVQPLVIETVEKSVEPQDTVTETVEVDEPEEVTVETEEEPYITIYYTEQDVIDIAKVLYNECRGVGSKTEQACVAWTILNRADNHGLSISAVIRAKNQFAFNENTTVDDSLLNLASDVLWRWNSEKNGETEVGRVLPKEYTYFAGRCGHNYFRNGFDGEYSIWDYSLESPYEN
jgi:spore germination cell wall hydrolase CwlJ-like protein